MGRMDSPEAEGVAKPEGALKTAGRAFLHSAIQDPLEGIGQLVNHVTGHELIPEIHLVDAPAPAKFGSGNWFAETIGSGFGMIVPYLAVEAGTNATLGKLGSVAEKMPMGADLMKTLNMSAEEAESAGWLANSVRFAAPASKMALNGAVYGLVMTPSNDPNKGFWEQRGIAAGSSAITFGAMGLASSGIMAGAEAKFKMPVNDAAFNLSMKGIGIRMGANALGGAVGGFASAESNSILNGNGAATGEQIGKSMASFMVTGAALDGAHIAGEFYGKALQDARERAANEAEQKSLPKLSPADTQMLEKIQEAHFKYFQQESDPETGLTKDRSTDTSPASIAAVGFSLTAHGVAIDHGWISHDEGADYTLKVLNTLWNSKQGPEAAGTSGDHGFFYHFLDPKTGTRAGQNELSTIDTALLMSGVLFSRNYFDGDTPKDAQIRDLSTKLFNRVDWNWALNKQDGRLSMGWNPESGFIPYEWQAYNEAPIMLLMGMGSPTHPLPADAWQKYMATAKTSDPYGHEEIEFGPLFGHQYSQVWLDLRGIKDATMKKLGSDYFENSRQATLAQEAYAIDNPQKFKGYSSLDWGLTASDGPADVTKVVDGISRTFHTYNARGFPDAPDDGTIAPTAAASSLPFAPEIVMPTLRHWMAERPELLTALGFADAFNPTFGKPGADPTVPEKPGSSGWVDKEMLGIDQGPILLMADNYRTNGVWRTMRHEPVMNNGLERAGFSQRPMPYVSPFAPITYGIGQAVQSAKKVLNPAPAKE